MERQCAAVVVVGSDFDEPGDPGRTPRELAFNARLATEFGSVVVPVVDGFGQDAGGGRGRRCAAAYHALADLGATVLAVIANRVPDPSRLTLAGLPVPAYAIPEVPSVSAPTVAEVAAALGATLLAGDDAALGRDVLDFVVGAAHVPTLLDHLTDGALVITPGDRADLLVAASAAHVAGQVVGGRAGAHPRRAARPAGHAAGRAAQHRPGGALRAQPTATTRWPRPVASRAGLSAANPRKVEAALGAFERSVDTDELARRLRRRPVDAGHPADVRERADRPRPRRNRRHLVLPEGTDERILRAAEMLLRRGVAELTLLGRPDEIARRARELGIDIGDAPGWSTRRPASGATTSPPSTPGCARTGASPLDAGARHGRATSTTSAR